MEISDNGLELIKEFEGFMAEPYVCSGGHNTIGYGNTMYNDGRKVELTDPPITMDEATDMLKTQVEDDYSACVNRYAKSPTTQNQFDAMVSFTYNLGCGNFKKSTLLRKHERGDHLGAAKEFPKWVRAGGRVLKGLVRRRETEKALYETIEDTDIYYV